LRYSASVDVAALSTPQQVQAEEENVRRNARPTVGDNWEQRCTFALQHAVEALEFLSNNSVLNQISELGMTLYLFSINRGKTKKTI
jgi:hypothetical protein